MHLKFLFMACIVGLICTASGSAIAQNSLNLEQCIAAVKRLSLEIDIADQNILKRSIDANIAKVNSQPEFSLVSDYEHLIGVDTVINSLEMSWDLAAVAKGNREVQESNIRAAQKQKKTTEAWLVFQVKALYYNLMRFKQELYILQENHAILTQQRAITAQLVSSQLKLDSSLSRIDDQVNSITNKILLKKGTIGQTRSALIQLINIPDTTGVTFADCDKTFIPLPDRSQARDKALISPAIQSLHFEKKALTESLHRPWLDKLPVMTLSAGYQQEWPVANDGTDYRIVFSFPLLDMGRSKSRHAELEALITQKNTVIRQKIKTRTDRISNLYEKAELCRIMFTAYQKTHSHRIKTLKLTKSEYASGLASAAELINTQKDAIDTEFQINKTFYDYMTLVAELDYLQGTVH